MKRGMEIFQRLLLAGVLLGATSCFADDIEIYLNGASSGGEPYVHLMLDYRPSVFSALCKYDTTCGADTEVTTTTTDPVTGDVTTATTTVECSASVCFTPEAYVNLGTRVAGETITRFDAFIAVMATIFDNPLFENIYMSLLISNFDNGGTILEGYKLLKDDSDKLITTLKAIPEPANNSSSHKLQPSETYYEWYRYANGGDVINGTSTAENFDDTATPDYDDSIMNAVETEYVSPFTDPGSCSKLFSILVAMNSANQDDSLDTEIEADMSADASTKFEDMMEYMHASDSDLLGGVDGVQPLEKSWVISDSGSLGATGNWATAGGSGSPLDIDDPTQLEEDLTNAFKEVISVSSTFVAASVPVNVFNRAQTLDNLYIALFEAQATLRWPGNIKKLKLVDTDSDGIFDDIQDVGGDPGFESTGDDRGRISFDAVTFWTDVSELPSADGELIPDNADGRVVSRGGAGQKIVGFIEDGTHVIGDANSDSNARQVFVEPASGTAFDDFDADNTTASNLLSLLDTTSSISTNDAKELIKWGRGQDVDNEDGDSDTDDPRSWILADAIHSRPLAINYGLVGGYSDTDYPNIRLFMGTGDGMFHIIENTSAAGVETGEEVFAFYPREMLKNIAEDRVNTEPSLKMRYGVDGAPVAFTNDINADGNLKSSDGDEVYVYFGLRRGGYSYYALDVSDPAATPTLKWKITQTSGGDFDELGLTFSTPKVGKVKFGSTATDVLVFAGGYNGGWDSTYTNRVGKDLDDSDDSVGNAIYIVNARTGALIWKAVQGTTGNSSSTQYEHADLVDSIPSDVTVLKKPNGNIHRIYVGDSGGAVWRVDLPEGDETVDSDHRKDNWFITKLAELGTDGTTTDRRFFHGPDVVETKDENGSYDGVLISSGDRADPNGTDVVNYHVYIKDRLINSGDAAVKARSPLTIADADLPDQTDCIVGDEGVGSCAVSLINGWKIELEDAGEKGLSTPLVDAGRAFLTTFVPSSGVSSCEPNEGTGYVYLVNLSDGTAVANDQRRYDVGPGIPSGAITLGNVILLPGGGADLGDLDGDGVDDSKKLPPSLGKSLYHIYWREPSIDDL